MHYAWMASKKQHAGIILSDQLAIGVILHRLIREDIENGKGES
jgi:hypothetical protein